MTKRKIIYITNVRLPTEKAHGLQIMKMCEAFSKSETNSKSKAQNLKFSVELIIPKRVNALRQDPFDYYGVGRFFEIKKLFCIDLFWLKIVPAKLSFYIQWLSFGVFASLYAVFKYRQGSVIFYSRDWLILFFLCLFGLSPIAEIHDYKAEKPKKWWRGYVAEKVKKIITNSGGTKKFLQEHYEILDNKILAAPNGVDIDFFDITQTKEQARGKLNLPMGKVIISYVGRLETLGMEKGVANLIKAFAQLEQHGHNVFLAVIGGPEALVAKYKKIARNELISPGKIIFSGHVGYAMIPFWLRAVDIVVVPFPATKQFSQTASPIKIFEFMAATKAIAASDLPVLREVLNENNAIFFEPANIKDMAEKISTLIEDRILADRISHRARESAREHTWLKRAEKITSFIQ